MYLFSEMIFLLQAAVNLVKQTGREKVRSRDKHVISVDVIVCLVVGR